MNIVQNLFFIRGNDSTIYLNSNLDSLNNIGTLIHEFSHIQLWHTSEDHQIDYISPGTIWFDAYRALKELEAETLTYLLCQDLWIDRQSSYYIRSWKDWSICGDELYKKVFNKAVSTYKSIKKDLIGSLCELNWD